MGEHENDPCMTPDENPDPEVIAGTAAPASQDMPTPRKGSGKRVAAAVAGGVALIAVALVAFLSWSFLPIPEVLGRDPLDATATVASASERWRTELVFEDGSSADGIGEGEAGDYEVRAVEPVQGSRLNRLSDEVVVLTVAKTDEALAREEAEREAAEEEARRAAEEKAAAEAKARRDEVAEREIADSFEREWSREEYEDGGSYLLFKMYHESEAASTDLFTGWWLYSSEDENVERYDEMADEAQADIIAAMYTNDGYLYGFYCSQYDGVSNEGHVKTAAALEKLVEDSKGHAEKNRETYLDNFVAIWEETEGCSSVEYSIFGDEIVIYIYSDYSGELYWAGTTSEVEEILRMKNVRAHDMSLFTNADITIRYISYDGIPFTDGGTFVYRRNASS